MFKKGTIVLVPFPFTDLSASKVRPAIILSNKVWGDDVIVAFVSSHPQSRLLSNEVLIHAGGPANLKVDSVIKLSKLATLDKKMILGELGAADQHSLREINRKLKLILGV